MEITKGNAPYEGGVGGKFQKRSFRRAPATPYDRPSSAARVSAPARPSESHAGDVRRGGRWLSKLVDPASRIVAQGASRLFSSFFRKKLTAPPDASELKVKSQEEASNASHIIQNSASEVNEQDLYENNAVNDHASDRALQETCSHVGQTFDLEQLLKQKTFTRFEFDRMMELLRSRTVEPSTSYPPFSSQEINGNVKQHSLIDRRIPESDMTHDNKDKESPGPKLGISFGSHADNTTPVDSLVLMDKNLGEQAGSPANIAKMYMDSTPSNRSPGILSAQKQINEEDRVSYNNSQYIKKPFDPSVASRSIYTSATPGLAKNSLMTPRIHGKSATYRMPHSSHFKLPLTAKAGSPSVDQYVWSSSSEFASTGVIESDDRQRRKRGRLVLDDDTRSFGPVRRLRQKIHVTSRYSNSSLKYLSSPLTTSHSYKSPNQKSLNLDDQRQSVVEMNGAENSVVASASIVPIPPQSREMARRILDQLDKLKSSPKGKSSNKLKTTDEEESPSNLTYNMLHERALRSMEDIDSSKFLSVEGNNQIEPTSDVHHEVLRSSSDQNQARPKENGLLEPSVLGVKTTAEAHPAKLVVDIKSSMKSSELSVSNGSSSAKKKPSFCISIPEDSLDFDDDDYTTKDSNPAMVEEGKLEVLSDHESTHSERGKLIKVTEASKIVPMHTPLLETKKDPEKKNSDKPVRPGKDGLMFPTDPTSSRPTQVLPYCSSDTISVLSESSAPVKMESGGFKIWFGLKQAQKSSSSITDDTNGPVGGNSVGSASTSVTPLGDLNSDKGDKNVTEWELSKLSGNAVVPIFKSPSSSLSTFTVSATSTMSNGTPSLLSGTSTSIVSAMANSGTGAMPDFSTSTTMASSTSSSALTTGFAIPTFQFGTGHPSSATENVISDSLKTEGGPGSSATENVISDSLKTEGGSVKLTASGTGNSIVSDISPAFSNAGGNNSAFTSAAVSSTISTSFPPAPLFCSSSDTGSSSVSASSAPSGSTNSFFGFGSSSQSSGLNISFPSTSSQTTSTPFGFTAGTTFSNQGTQSAGESHILQNSVNQIGSLSSPTMFGANGCSSSSSSKSLFASATFTAKPSGSGPEITSTAASFSNSASSTSFTPSTFSSSSGFSFTAKSSSTTAFASTTPFISSSSSSFSFSTGVGSSSGSGSSTSFAAGPTNSTFNSSSQKSPSSIFDSFNSSMSSPSTGSSLASSASGNPFTFGTSSVPTFSFSATGTAVSSMPLQSKPVFGVSNQLPPMNSGSPGNDHMNVEDSMTDSPVQAPANAIATFGTTFGQPSSAPATPSFVFGSPAVNATPSAFHFGGQHGSSIPQNTSPFQPTGSLEFSAGGSFSLGSGAGGGDKSGRKFVRVRRDKLRKK